MDLEAIPQLEKTVAYNIDSDTNSPQKILTTSDLYAFMITSPDSPRIGNEQENIVYQAIDDKNFVTQHLKSRKRSKRFKH